MHRLKKAKHFNSALDSLIKKSPWTQFCRTDNVVNMSSTLLSDLQLQVLGLGFSLPHKTRDIIDFVANIDKSISR